jgi:hypothetical protein
MAPAPRRCAGGADAAPPMLRRRCCAAAATIPSSRQVAGCSWLTRPPRAPPPLQVKVETRPWQIEVRRPARRPGPAPGPRSARPAAPAPVPSAPQRPQAPLPRRAHPAPRLPATLLQLPSRKLEVELTTVSSNYHVELNPSDVGNNDRYVVQVRRAAARWRRVVAPRAGQLDS